MLWMVMGLLSGMFTLSCLGQAEPGAAQADQKAKAAEAAAKTIFLRQPFLLKRQTP